MNTNTEFTLPEHSRIWVYQSSRFLSSSEVEQISDLSSEFLLQWHSHGNALSAEIKLLNNLFLIIAVDEKTAPASGCSIDKSVRFIKDIEKLINISLTGRSTVAYFEKENKIVLIPYLELIQKIKSGEVNENQLLFNNLLSTISDFKKNRFQKIGESWLKQISV